MVKLNKRPLYLRQLKAEIILFLLLFETPFFAGAQDNHYWAQQYGATGTLMGGAMVGGVNDNSAIYYNPGALGFISNPGLSVDANVYRMDKVLIKDGAGKDLNLNSAQLSVYPQIIAGMVNLFKESRFRFSYTMLTRNHGNILMNARYTSASEPSGSTSASSYVGGYDFVNQLNEQWFGVGAGYRISGKIGAGASIFGIYRGQSYQMTNYVQEVEPVNNYNVFRTQTVDEAFKYTNYNLITKFGLSYSSGVFKLGATITTPSVRLFGNGNVQRENSRITVSGDTADMENNFLIMDRKTGEKAHYRHPLSIAAGAEYMTTKTRIAISAEYFFRTKNYYLLKPETEPFVYPPSYLDSTDYKSLIDNYLDVELVTKPVLNFGVGFSSEVYKDLTLMIGASTDFSSYDEPHREYGMLKSLGGFNIFHFSSGFSYSLKKQSVTIGFSYAYSPDKKIPPSTIINQSPEVDEAILSTRSYAIILGYTYYFSRAGDL